MSNFKVGERVVAVRTHSQRCFVKGQLFTVLGVKTIPCCKYLVVDVGLRINHPLIECHICGSLCSNDNMFYHKNFKPLSDYLSSLSETELNEIEKTFPEIKIKETV